MNSKLVNSSQFSFIETEIDDVFIVEKSLFEDHRGTFIKIFNEAAFSNVGLSADFKESYFSVSNKDVLRGMHYQQHPYGHAKLVSVIEGEILDVIVGIGGVANQRNYGKVFSTILSKENNRSLYIPDGYAHGFLVLSDHAIVINHMTSVFNAESDTGIHFRSFDYDWPTKSPIVSDKDSKLKPLTKLASV